MHWRLNTELAYMLLRISQYLKRYLLPEKHLDMLSWIGMTTELQLGTEISLLNMDIVKTWCEEVMWYILFWLPPSMLCPCPRGTIEWPSISMGKFGPEMMILVNWEVPSSFDIQSDFLPIINTVEPWFSDTLGLPGNCH